MFKKSLLLTLLLALLVPWAANAQNRTDVTVDFETGDLSQLAPFTVVNDASYPWATTNASNNTTSGTYSIKSGNGGKKSSESNFQITVIFTDAGTISFGAKISSEASWDKGYFYIDGAVQSDINAISGNGSWIQYNYNVTAGSHTFKWKYTKDSSGDQFDDCFYVDDIAFTNAYVPSCFAPTDLEVTSPTPHGATASWTGTSDSYIVMVGPMAYDVNVDFETGDLSQASFTTTTTSYPWTAVSNNHSGAYCAKSGNDGVSSSTSDMVLEVTLTADKVISFSAKISSESSWDKGYFSIDGTNQINAISGNGNWIDYSYPLTTGTHTLRWYYTKDSSGDSDDDCFYVDDIKIGGVSVWDDSRTTTNTTLPITGLNPSTAYQVKVKGVCGSEQSDASAAVTFTTLDACPTPGVPTASSITNNSAALSWTENGTATAWDIYLTTTQTDVPTSTTTPTYSNVNTNTNCPIGSLIANTTYYAYVRALCDEASSWSTAGNFTTECGAFSINPTAYQYGFETADDMDCWELVNGVTNTAVWDNATINYNFGYEPARTGDYCFMFFYVDYDDTDPEYQTLISPQLTDLPANGVHVEFYYVGDLDGSGQETFRVGYSTTDKNLSSFTWGTEITDASTAYQRFSANYPQGTKYVAVQHTSDDQYYLFLDDFTFEGAADCLEPSNVLADNITTTGASITWTAGGEETAWDIYVTDNSTIVPDDGTTPTYANISTKPYPLTPLTPATTYYVYVRAACSSTETSAWSSPGIFHTECEGMDLPYGPYGFEDGALSVCWNVINTNTSYNSVSVSASNANLGTHCLSFFRGATTGDLVAVLPEVGAYNLSDYQFEFNAKGSYAGYEITIGIMTDPDDLTTFVAQGDVITTTTSYAEHKVRFNGYTGTGKYVVISVVRPSTVTYGSIYVDDIAINPIPSCIEPTGLAVTAPTPHGATFSWTNGGSETEWHLYFGKNNTAPADDIDLSKVTVANSNPFTMTTGLDPETDYYVWVRANCGSTDGYSSWVGPKTFTTTVACPAPTGLTASEVTNHTAKLSWTGTSESYNVWYRTAATMSNPIFSETFETSSLPTGWDRSSTALTDDVLNGTTTINSYSGGWVNTSYGLGQYNWKMNIYSTGKYWLITPSITLDAKNTLNFNAAITAYNSNNAPTSSNMADGNSRFVVLITTDNQATWTILREWNNTGSADVLNNISNTGNNFSIDLTAYAGETVKIAFYGGQTSSGPDCDLHIDNVVIGTPVEAGEWTKKTADASPYEATGLLAETKYEAQVQGNCGSEGTSQWTSSVFFTTDIACPAPTGLAASNATSSSFDLSWTNGGSEDWIVAYKKTTDADFTEKAVNISQVTVEASLITYTLSGLEAETEYTVKVRDNCEASYVGDGMSEWTAEVPYSTIAACSALNPVVDPASITHHNATVTWDGESTSGFNVNYREAAYIDGIPEEFSSSSAPEGWTRYSGEWNSDGTGPTSTTTSGWSFGAKNFTNSHAYMNMYSDWKYWLVTPSITVGSNYEMNFDAAYTKYNATTTPDQTGTDDRFVILISTDNKAHWTSLREWNNAGTGDAVLNDLPVTFQPVDPIDLSAFNGQTVYIAFYGASTESNTDNHLRIDNVVIGVNVPAATTWQTQAATTTTADLTGLTAGTKYDVKVVPNCDATLESTTVQFTTMSANEKQFITAGDWATATNWLDGEMPTIADNAVIKANATINNGTVATANNISFQGSPTPTLTIENGAQLKHNNTSSINATVKKTITGYGTANANTNNGYVLFAPPIGKTIYTNNSDGTGLRNGTYDLYTWNRTNATEWTYYGSNNSSYLSMSRGTGYLYACEDTREITFTGSIYGSGAKYSKSVSYNAPGTGTEFSDWNLIGNPFVCDAYLATEDGKTLLAYYKMNDDGNSFTAVSNGAAIASMQGIFYQATAAGNVYFFRELPSASVMPGNLNINVAQVVNSRDAHRSTDNAIIRFGEGNTLEKFSFNANNAKVYIPQDGKDYAVVNAANEGEMPVNFKAAENGSYTISFTAEDVNFSYLHLIDNLTGNEVNLLETPSYSFDARTIDYASRFKLVFVTGQANMGDDFGFFDANGNLMILGIEGTATLQMIDVTGRIISSETFSGNYSKAINAKAGVYMLRLIQGNDVRTQKIVVK